MNNIRKMNGRSILVTGGAGYIGSVAVKRLIEEGHEVVVVDNLSKGLKRLVNPKATFYRLDLVDAQKLSEVFKKHTFDTVMHFAAYKNVGESMTNQNKYTHNIIGSRNLIDKTIKHQIPQIIFSSSAAVYGEPEYLPIDEAHSTKPTNYYGQTKLQTELDLEEAGKAHNLNYISLRYFNVAGDGELNYLDPHALNIIPVLMEVASGMRNHVEIFGTDYNTTDGSCIRDYIDVNDLVEAHLLALNLKSSEIINLGTEHGTSMLELIRATEKVTGRRLQIIRTPRRKGDPERLVANFSKAKQLLGWEPQRSMELMIESAWKVYSDDAG